MIDPKWHGTTNGYSNLGCRCEACCAANTEAAAKYRNGVRSNPIPEWKHGTPTGYRLHLCRCERCRRAMGEHEHYRKNRPGEYMLPEERRAIREIREQARIERQAAKRRFDSHYEVEESGCWIWTASWMWHSQSPRRVAFTEAGNVIPEGRNVSVTCGTRNCVNPEHMTIKPVKRASTEPHSTHWEGQETCHNGHLLSPDNIRIRPHDGHRECRQCNADRCARYRAKRHGEQILAA